MGKSIKDWFGGFSIVKVILSDALPSSAYSPFRNRNCSPWCYCDPVYRCTKEELDAMGKVIEEYKQKLAEAEETEARRE